MTITPFEMYLLTRLDALGFSFFMFGVIGTLAVVATGVNIKRWAFWFLPIPIGFLLLSVLTPTTKQAAAIIMVPAIVNNEEVQKLPDNILRLANEWLEELGPGKEKSR